MSRPKIHATSRDRSRIGQAAFRARQKTLTPLERIAGKTGVEITYTETEQAYVTVLKDLITELETKAATLNTMLAHRLGANHPLAGELDGYTRVQIRTF